MTANDVNEILIPTCITLVICVFLYFLINWNNNLFKYYMVEEYLRATNCYTVKDNYNNAPRDVSYCDKRSLSELIGDPNDR